MSNDLDKWLLNVVRSPMSADFTVFDVSEQTERDASTKLFLESVIGKFLMNPIVLDGLRAHLGEDVRLALDAATPSTRNLRAGAFGEALSAEICERWHAYVVPLRRLRFSGGSPPGTDLLALRIDGADQLTEVCYIECKLRTTNSTRTAFDAYEQLLHARQERIPVILNHVANYLADVNSHLLPSFIGYMSSRASQPASDSYRIALTWENETWSQTVLDNLQDGDLQLTPLTVDVIRIASLRDLIEEIYGGLGVEALNDDNRPD